MRLEARLAACVLSGLLAPALQAQASPFYAPPAPEADAPAWGGEAELGFTRLAGNTDSRTLAAKGKLTWLTGDLTHSLGGQVRHVTQDDRTRTERYRLVARERYDIDGPHYAFGFARWDKDRFGGYDHQLAAIAGYGRRLLSGDDQELSLEAGPGYRHDAVIDEADRRLGVLYGALDYRRRLNEAATLGQELALEQTEANLTVRSQTSIRAPLGDHLALKLSHEIEYTSHPPAEATAKADRVTGVSLHYDW
ncbi:DUF481 domain-containing protein [Halomonas koreensis]|uniref:DUF481 domain-containing protein n=1 Tax=Halomonas koreensis TaxID=245385 RepID=A0ABU1G2R6_9GAMM|nr:DUF481 domain-containing protein [Halomonas koreensis]MDR5867232.1 DUF481 domain-containing protein [Halomonas koreensis]